MITILAAKATADATTWPDVALAAIIIAGVCFMLWVISR